MASQRPCIEQFIQEREKMHASWRRGPRLISIIDTEEYDDDDDMLVDQVTNILTVEILKSKNYMCSALRSTKGKDIISLEDWNKYTKDGHIFDVIFSFLIINF